ncbi:MAG TPA: toll/interleukin-1 receptor domain-containing protein [Pyrinomonadaceae bacterium]|jgi:tetratricopeptide (TPR) repeat protein|nr:toll/interleukin-1 receptor domain-containing protein [Pyrinomonadaceae bacterium]
MSSNTSPPLEVFYSYAHEDEKLLKRLNAHLALLKQEGLIKGWHDREIKPGAEWADEISDHLDSAHVILLLVSPDFMASEYCSGVEMKRALERHERREALVIPVILRPVEWQGGPLAKLQALPAEAKPVVKWKNRDDAFLSVAQGLRTVIKDFHPAPPAVTEPPPVPRPPTFGFVARHDAQGRDIVGRLKEELAPGQNRLVTLSGPGGIGKTTLAAEAARALLPPYANRVVWSRADGRTDYTLPTLLDDIATQLGRPQLRTLAPDAKAEQVRDLADDAPTLVVLDNCETIADGEQQRIESWFQQTQCSALFTSRPRVAETIFVAVAAMSREEAEEFLEKVVRQLQEPDLFTPEIRRRIYETAEANPFVMQWVAAQIDEQGKEPEKVLEELKGGQGKAAERVFGRSFNLPRVGDDGRDTLLALSLFTPGARRDALAQVAGLDEPRLNEAVTNLRALWLVKGLDSNRRLGVEGLTRTLTESRLAADPRADDFGHRFVNYFVKYALDRKDATADNYDALEAEKDNLLKAAELSSALGDVMGLAVIAYVVAAPTTGMLSVRGYWDEAVRLSEQAVRGARLLSEDKYLSELTHNLAVMYGWRGEPEKARRLYEESMEITRRRGDRSGLAATLHEQGRHAHDRGQLEEARRLYNESFEINKELGNRRDLAATLHQLGRLAQDEGDFDEARRLYAESAEAHKAAGNERGVAMTTSQLGILLWMQGRAEESQAKHEESLALRRKLGDRSGVSIDLHQLGILAQQRGDTAEARRLYDESLEIKKALGDRPNAAATLHQLGMLAEAEGDRAEAVRLFREAITIFESLGSPYADTARQSLDRVEGRAPETGT